MSGLLRVFIVGIMTSIAAFATYAFASSNSGIEMAGEAAAPITGWSISDVRYQYADNPASVESVAFNLDAPARQASVKLSSTATEFTPCTNLGAYYWQCNFQAGVNVADMDEFRVIAVGN